MILYGIIPNDSRRPKEDNLAAIRYLYNRMNSYKLSSENLHEENNTIQQILHNNGFDTSIAKSIQGKKKKDKDSKKTQWAKFTYIGKETRATTKAFKNTNVKITFSTNNTTGKILATRHHRTKCK